MADAKTILNYLNNCALVDQPATLSRENCMVLLAEFNAMYHTVNILKKQVEKKKDYESL